MRAPAWTLMIPACARRCLSTTPAAQLPASPELPLRDCPPGVAPGAPASPPSHGCPEHNPKHSLQTATCHICTWALLTMGLPDVLVGKSPYCSFHFNYIALLGLGRALWRV